MNIFRLAGDQSHILWDDLYLLAECIRRVSSWPFLVHLGREYKLLLFWGFIYSRTK